MNNNYRYPVFLSIEYDFLSKQNTLKELQLLIEN